MKTKSIENVEAWHEECRKNYEYHMSTASAWYEEMRKYEQIIEEIKEQSVFL
jgi:hypothetical protein